MTPDEEMDAALVLVIVELDARPIPLTPSDAEGSD
jgi:hypothetical protein